MQWAVWFTVGVWPLYSQLDKHVTFKNIQNATSLSKNTKEETVCQQNCLKLAGIQQKGGKK